MEKISYVIPCYGSEKTIISVVEEIRCLMKGQDAFDYEIILVNDHSPDHVWDVIQKLCSEHPEIMGIHLAKNFGQHSALMAGYNKCRGDYIITMDDDGQTPVNQTFLLIDKVFEGYDVVYAKYEKREDNVFRRFGTVVNNYMSETLLDKPKGLHLTSFFCARSYVIKEVCNYHNAFPYIWGLVLRTTKNITNVTIQHSRRLDGESGYTLHKLLSLWMNGFTAFSVKPLHITAIVGAIFAFVGMAGILYTIVNKCMHPDIMDGYSSLMSVLLVTGGMVMLSLGLIGEYVGRIYLCINTMPQYVVKEILNESDGREDGK